jgi:hypothetical protein
MESDGACLPGDEVMVEGDWRLCSIQPPWYVIYHDHGGALQVVFRRRYKGILVCPKCKASPPKRMVVAMQLLRMGR